MVEVKTAPYRQLLKNLPLGKNKILQRRRNYQEVNSQKENPEQTNEF